MSRPSLQAWLCLVRPPNLPTVPGDPLAGFLLAGGAPDWRLLGAMCASLLIYAAGLVLNDVADIEIDRRERPGRSLPSGRVSLKAARRAGVALGVAGLAVAAGAGAPAFLAACGLFVLVLCYDFLTPRGSAGGLAVMGACRPAGVGLGIVAAGHGAGAAAPAWLAAAGIGLYIVAVSWLATGETVQRHLGSRRWLPLASAAAMLAGLLVLIEPVRSSPWPLAIGAAAFGAIWRISWRVGPRPAPPEMGRAIGAFIRALLWLQAACCAMTPGGWKAALPLILLIPLSASLARDYHAS
ncbi:MAG: UbiA family prenyltransferase [Kiritimatiellae bacterium]|nr:UbiA family prenyltransferase [Kiritimatiellia bacterium]